MSYGSPVRAAEMYRWEGAVREALAVAAEDAATGRDEGTCVLGAGVAVWHLPRGCRNPRRVILVPAPFQGNVGSFHACERALAILKAAGLDATWYDGVMD